MNHNSRDDRTDEHPGQSLIEFALVLPIIVLLIFGAMDIGRIITTKIVMTNAAREGANYLSRTAFLDPENKDLSTRISETKTLIYDYCASQKIDIDQTDNITIGNVTVGLPLSITVHKDVDLFFGSLLQFLGVTNDGAILVASTIQMKVK